MMYVEDTYSELWLRSVSNDKACIVNYSELKCICSSLKKNFIEQICMYVEIHLNSVGVDDDDVV